jgi:gliding motility-associated-like protein
MRLSTRSILLTFLILFCSLASFALTANFTADYVAGCAPLVVHFTNTTSPSSGTTYFWDLGNGTISPLTDVSGSYLTPGTYTVRLTATNGGVTSVHTITITVYPSPTVSFFASDTTICPGSSVTFTSTSTSGVPGGMTYLWNFGDGSSGTGSPITHTFAASGYYNITLSVTNADGCVSSLTKGGYIYVYTPATPNFSASSNYFCKAPGHVVFTNLTSGTAPFTYIWRFGDGSAPSTATAPTHDYLLSGIYTVTLVVTDGHGCTDSLVMPAFITVSSLHAAFTFPSTVCVNSAVNFTNISSPHISSAWDFGDGNSATTEPGYDVYPLPGVYTVRLIVYDGYCYDTITHNITVVPGPGTSFTITPAHACPPPVGITFTGLAPSGSTVTWLYGDGMSGSGMTSMHTYARRGVDTIRMICYDPATGCRDTIKRIDTLYDMIFTLIDTPDHGCKPLTVGFRTKCETYEADTVHGPYPYPWPITTWTWNYGDGSPTGSGGPTSSHTYTATGTFHAVVTCITGNGCTIVDSVTILVGSPPVVTFTATPTHQCYHGNNIFFNGTVITGPVDEWVWEFGDGGGTITSAGSTSYHFTRPGVFGATVTPYYHGCPGPPFGLSNIITIDSPMAIIHAKIDCTPLRRIEFGDSSLGDDTHLWIFGDGTTSTLDNPIHDYPAMTTYTVTLATYNVHSGCRDTSYYIGNLQRPVPVFSTPDTTICKDSIVILTATVLGGTASAYWWHSAGRSLDSNSAVYIDTFYNRGIYPIMLIIMDQNGCLDTTVRPNYILVAKPHANFTVSPATGCWPLTTTFTDVSNDVPGTFFIDYSWVFGDGGTAYVTTPAVTHTYTAAGTFTTTEIVIDNIGCRDTVALPLITVYRPHAVFTASNLNPCPIVDSTQFLNTSVSIVSSFWMFGDGTTSTVYAPWHTYMLPGAYTVKLVVTDSHGCVDTMVRVAYINVTKPVASFYMNDSVSICPPLMVNFFNTSTGSISWQWDLGDGSSSVLFSPSDLYTGTGYDTVMLIAVNAYGCRDTVYGHVNLFGYAGAFQYTPDSGCAPLHVKFHATTLNVPNIIWDFADGNTSHVAFTDTTSHDYLLPGAYVPKLILSDNTGCQNSSLGIDTIKVDAVYGKFRILPDPICIGDSFMLADSSSSYWSWITNWNWTVNGLTSTIDSPTFFINVPGTYTATLIATDGWGCTATVIKPVDIFPLPVVTVSPDTVICVTDAAVLTGYGAYTYTWSPGATLSCTACNPTHATPTVVTNYTVTGTDIHGCKSWDTTTVLLRTNTISAAGVDTEICAGVVVPLWDTGGTKYTWIPAVGLSDPHSDHPMATPMQTTKYMVIAQLAGCIPDTNYVLIYVHQLPTVDAGPDQTLVAGSQAQLNATGYNIYRYGWDNPGSLSCDSCSNPVATPSVTTKYHVTVRSDFGCLASDTVTIHIFCSSSQIFVPNSFTPNGDGENDVFYPRGIGVSSIKSFRIYNRWGQLLFERSGININDATNAWDGSYNGGTPRPDVYVWVIDAVCEAGDIINMKGDVTIIR